MSDEPGSPRKSSDAASSLRGAVPKTKRKGTKKRAKSPLRFRDPMPFFDPDCFADVNIIVDDRRLYFNRCILCYHSKVFEKQLEDDTGKGRGPAKPVNKELNLSDRRFDDIVELVAYMHPKVPYDMTDQAAMRLAKLAEDYDMMRLKKDCEETLTSSYAAMRKNKQRGMMPTETTLQFLEIADKYKYEKLLSMCIDDCVVNPYIDAKIEKMDDDYISYPVQREILRRKNIDLRHKLSKKSRELEIREGGDKEEPRLWRR